ncbi:MAG TPA: adenylate/guanylate cyclase domain-containing protein, partial [Allocoleopsis sp.]
KPGLKLPLRLLIVTPLVLQILAVAGIIGGLSFVVGKKAINDLITELGDRIGDNVVENTQKQLNQTFLLHQSIGTAMNHGDIDINQPGKIQHFLWDSLQKQPVGTSFQFANEQGDFVGVRVDEGNKFIGSLKDKSTNNQREIHELNGQGYPIKFKERYSYNPLDRPWYIAAKKAGKSTWSDIYSSTTRNTLVMSASQPIYDRNGKFNGVLSLQITLSNIREFLQTLNISKYGQAFIIEKTGHLVAESSKEQLFFNDKNQKTHRYSALDSENGLIKETAKHLAEKFSYFKTNDLKEAKTIIVDLHGEKQLVRISPLKDEMGLDWLIVVVIPEADFMENINNSLRHTVIIAGMFLILAVIFGWTTSTWIVKPILRLNDATKKMAQGQWDQSLPDEKITELDQLANSFDLMKEQLKESFETLEQKVQDRTAELAEANVDLEVRNQLIRKVFGRYLTDEVVANLLENPENLKLGGEKRKITILTSDLRGFTANSARLEPEDVIKTINMYLHHMAEIITKYHGTIDEFMGDGILVLFGAPNCNKDDAIRAIACAIEMQLEMSIVNEKVTGWGLPPLEMGIGINTGEVIVGNIGSEKRAKYGVVGNEINVTYRIESYSVGGQILISESTYNEAKDLVQIFEQKSIQPKGVSQPINIYELGGIGGDYNLYLPKEEQIFRPLSEVINLQYTTLEGKHIGNNFSHGSLIEISAKAAKVRLKSAEKDDFPPVLTNIKINLLGFDKFGEVSGDIYAKVMAISEENNYFEIYFTNVPSEIKQKLMDIYQSLLS